MNKLRIYFVCVVSHVCFWYQKSCNWYQFLVSRPMSWALECAAGATASERERHCWTRTFLELFSSSQTSSLRSAIRRARFSSTMRNSCRCLTVITIPDIYCIDNLYSQEWYSNYSSITFFTNNGRQSTCIKENKTNNINTNILPTY